jgi:hypothetical protein
VHRKRQGEDQLAKAVPVKVAEVQNMGRHVLRIALVLWLRAALELAVRLERGDEVNRQAKMATLTKCRDPLQVPLENISGNGNLVLADMSRQMCVLDEYRMRPNVLIVSISEEEEKTPEMEAENSQDVL